MKKSRKVVLGRGYFDYADCRRVAMLWNRSFGTAEHQVRMSRKSVDVLLGKRVRLIAEIIEDDNG